MIKQSLLIALSLLCCSVIHAEGEKQPAHQVSLIHKYREDKNLIAGGFVSSWKCDLCGNYNIKDKMTCSYCGSNKPKDA